MTCTLHVSYVSDYLHLKEHLESESNPFDKHFIWKCNFKYKWVHNHTYVLALYPTLRGFIHVIPTCNFNCTPK